MLRGFAVRVFGGGKKKQIKFSIKVLASQKAGFGVKLVHEIGLVWHKNKHELLEKNENWNHIKSAKNFRVNSKMGKAHLVERVSQMKVGLSLNFFYVVNLFSKVLSQNLSVELDKRFQNSGHLQQGHPAALVPQLQRSFSINKRQTMAEITK